jgi:hypothetical protein
MNLKEEILRQEEGKLRKAVNLFMQLKFYLGEE